MYLFLFVRVVRFVLFVLSLFQLFISLFRLFRISLAMARSRSSRSSSLGFINKHNWVDWLVSILLVVAIIIVAVWVCNNPNRDSADDSYEEAFYSSCRGKEEEEGFYSPEGSSAATSVSSISQLDSVGDNDIGCCLVYYKQCGHCTQYKPVWQNICSKVNGKTYGGKRVKMFECGDDQHPKAWEQVSRRFGIQGYPTILVKIGGKNADWVEYTGSRNALKELLEKGG